MKIERVFLGPEDSRVSMDAYIPDIPPLPEKRAAMLILPGGGYEAVCADREGEPIALAFAARGMCAFVLHYRVGPGAVYPAQLLDASRAMVYIRAHGEEWFVDPHRVYTVGFSAGGHLAGCLATMHAVPEVTDELGIFAEENRPTAAILSYPVVSALVPTHEDSFVHLIGRPYAEIGEETRAYVSLETQVTDRTSPMFLWHTAQDAAVPPIGTLRLCEALLTQHIPCTMRLYPRGGHGIALANRITSCGRTSHEDPMCEQWVDEVMKWLPLLPVDDEEKSRE